MPKKSLATRTEISHTISRQRTFTHLLRSVVVAGLVFIFLLTVAVFYCKVGIRDLATMRIRVIKVYLDNAEGPLRTLEGRFGPQEKAHN